MTAKESIRHSLATSERILLAYLNDLSDEDLLVRPIAGMNPIAWQVGHLIVSERNMAETVKPGVSPPLSDAFTELHARDDTKVKPEAGWATKDEYIKLWKAQRAATLQALESTPEADLAKPSPERMHRVAKTLGEVLNMAGLHILLHSGQFVAVRRQLKKPIAI